MRFAASYIDLSGHCQIRPISDTDFEHLSIPRLPKHSVTWLYQNPTPMGIGGLLRVPGRPAEADVFLLMQTDTPQDTHGSRMLRFLIEQGRLLGIKRLFAVCSSLRTPYARFLIKFGFQRAYEEWDMGLIEPRALELPTCMLHTLPESESATLMRQLYTETFIDEPWYLPYASDTHLLDEFGVDGDLLFMYEGVRPIGFVGIRYEQQRAEIDVFGIVKSHQSAQRRAALMNAVIYHLEARACREVSLSLWRRNVEGVRLARSFNFQRIRTRVYMELNLTMSQ